MEKESRMRMDKEIGRKLSEKFCEKLFWKEKGGMMTVRVRIKREDEVTGAWKNNFEH